MPQARFRQHPPSWTQSNERQYQKPKDSGAVPHGNREVKMHKKSPAQRRTFFAPADRAGAASRQNQLFPGLILKGINIGKVQPAHLVNFKQLDRDNLTFLEDISYPLNTAAGQL